MAALTVADRGRGIPAEDQDRVFRAFERVRRPGGPEHGAGLGLSLVRRIVEMHGGRVSIDSRVGQGTTVTCLVPLQKEAPR